MLDVESFILVGGASSRMGTDKSRLLFANQTAVERISSEMASIGSSISLVGSSSESAPAGLKRVSDIHPRWGALGGIHAALNSGEKQWAMIVACDLPFVTRLLFSNLIGICAKQNNTVDAVVPIQCDGRPQPLCALYRRETCLREADRLIAAGEHTPRALLASVRTRWVQFDEIAALPNAEHFFLNVNTPADYERAQQIIEEL
jgi:molybdopterin-guanine dinucleotide biosynthesis protein A